MKNLFKKTLFTSILFVSNYCLAFDLDIDQLKHKTHLIYLSDQSIAGNRASAYYHSFNAVSYDGSSHNYLREKYKQNRRDSQIGFSTQLTENLAINYIFGIGSKSEKLEVQKSLKLGVTYLFGLTSYSPTHTADLGGYSYFLLNASHIFGGATIEKGCVDDFNKQYNCRSSLAQSDHPLINEKPLNQNAIHIKFTLVKDFF